MKRGCSTWFRLTAKYFRLAQSYSHDQGLPYKTNFKAKLDPLDLSEKDPPRTRAEQLWFSPKDWDRPIFIDNALGFESFLRQIMEALEKTYCGSQELNICIFKTLSKKMDTKSYWKYTTKQISQKSEKDDIRAGNRSRVFEKFLAVKYVGTKFGLDGVNQ